MVRWMISTLDQLMLLQVVVHLCVAPDRTLGTLVRDSSSRSLGQADLVDLLLGSCELLLLLLRLIAASGLVNLMMDTTICIAASLHVLFSPGRISYI